MTGQPLADACVPPGDRLSVRQIANGLELARELASRGVNRDRDSPPQDSSIDRRNAVRPDAAEWLDRPPQPSPETQSGTEQTTRPVHLDPWLPEHDGPVSLSGVAAPRPRPTRRSIAEPDSRPRRSARRRRGSDGPARPVQADPAVVKLAAGAPRLVVIPACGGAGATTTTVLFAAALAPVNGVVLLASGPDRAALTTSSSASGGDVDALANWLAAQQDGPLEADTPGLAIGDAGTGHLVVAAHSHEDRGRALTTSMAITVLTAAAGTRASVLLDWSSPEPLPDQVWGSATHIVVTAPSTIPGLLAAEYAVQSLQAAAPDDVPLSLITIDIRGRGRRRADRAALTRLRALSLPVTSLPYDGLLADGPPVHWPALRPRTRAAVVAAVAALTSHHRKDDR